MIRINWSDSIKKEEIVGNHTTNGGVVIFSIEVPWDKTGYIHLLDYLSYLVEDGEDFIFDSEFEFIPISLNGTNVIVDVLARNLDYYLYGETDPYKPDAESIGDDFG